jgi:hypothetical protein
MTSTLKSLGVAKTFAPECPSDLDLDRLFHSELDGDHPVRVHADACPECQRRIEERGQPIPAELSSQMLAAIHVGVVERAEADRWFDRVLRLLRPIRHLSVVAVAAVAVFVLMPREEVVRTKGKGFDLVVYRERGGEVEKMLSGEQFAPGDRLRFEVDLPQPGQLMIVGVEADGSKFPCYTGEGRRSVGQIETMKHVLPGAVELDDSEGKEQIHAILCRSPFEFDQVSIAGGKVVSPSGCMTAPFLLDKESE